MQPKTTSVTVGEHTISFETGRVARQANGAVIVRAGDTVVFASACATKDPLEGVDFLPLRVDYQEKFSSVGRTLSGFIKREGRPSERETLVSRLIDRPIRPLFPDGYYLDTQLLVYVWSYDGVHSPDNLAICAASAALAVSDIPMDKTLAGVRVGLVNGQFIVNPTAAQQSESILDLMLAGTEEAILMIEGYCDFLTEDQVMEAIETGHREIRKICQAQTQWAKEVGARKRENVIIPIQPDCQGKVEELANPLLRDALLIQEKQAREDALASVDDKVLAGLKDEGEALLFESSQIKRALKLVRSNYMRHLILTEKVRPDGRKPDAIRPIWIEPAFLPRTHGSTLFTRGETQTLAVATLGAENMAQRYEDLHGEGTRRFYLQYFFPPFSVGEVGRSGPAGRREIGHGKLAERALQTVLPGKEDFPYTIRLESNITESNGSSSMASVCGGCLALMDAGVPIKRPVSGIAMGLILEEKQFLVLSDILGIEDALGDMDFKVTGDRDGITAFQMDIKVEGITPEIMRQALNQAKQGRIHILEKMLEALPESRKSMSEYAPRIESIRVKPSKIHLVIGPGGKMIRSIIEQTGVEIDINDDGLVAISSSNLEGIEKAKELINRIVAEVEIGQTYKGKIVSIVPFGCFVEVLPGKEGLCHISELSDQRIGNISDFFKEGEEITVKVLDINERGQLKLSRKALLVGGKT